VRGLGFRRPPGWHPVTAFLCVVAALLGAGAGCAAHGLAGGALTRPLRSARDRAAGGDDDRAVPVPTLPRAAVAGGAVGRVVTAAVGAVATAAVVLHSGASADLPAWLWFVLVGLLLGVVDVQEHRLPDRVLLPGTALAVLLLTGAALASGREEDLARGLLAGAACFGLLLVMALVSPSGLGMGDVKLVAFTGLYLGWLGWPPVVAGLLLGFLAQGVLGTALLVVRRTGLRTELPFGPALLGGALVAALLQGSWAFPLR